MTSSDEIIRHAPLLLAMLGYAAQGRISFHMPGHQDGAGLPGEIRHCLAELDATELAVTDDLNEPAGPAADAMRLAADAFQAAETLFVTGGSTTAIQAMVTAFCPRGSLIVLPRTVHRSVLNIVLLLGLQVAFLPAEPVAPEALEAAAESFGMAVPAVDAQAFRPIEPPTAAALRQTLARHPEARAILVTSPDYFGTCPDLAALAAVAAGFGCPLLVDEAHGAHLCFAPDRLPPSALSSGASACVQSAHKTLPALTQGAFLHRGATAFLAGGQPWPRNGHLRQCLSLYQTSSPSLLIGATLDFARARMQADGGAAIASGLDRIERFRDALQLPFRCTGASGSRQRDPLRVVVDVLGTGLTGFEIARRLTAKGIDVEMADIRRLVLIPGLFQDEADLVALAAALNRIAAEIGIAPEAQHMDENRSLDQAFYRWLQSLPDVAAETASSAASPISTVSLVSTALPISPVLAGLPVRRVRLSEAAGERAAEAMVPYPPGIPLVWPGERLDEERLALLQLLLENGFCVHGTGPERENPGIWILA